MSRDSALQIDDLALSKREMGEPTFLMALKQDGGHEWNVPEG